MKQYKEGWELPNPFLNAEGKLVENPKEWEKQREYLKSLLIRYQYGTVPPAPPFYREEAISKKELLEGAGIEENIRLYFGPKGEITFRIIVLRPNDSEKHKTAIVPSYVNAKAAEESIRAGYCVVVFDPTEPAPDDFDYKRGSCYQTYPEYTWKVIAMWAWLQSRTLDYLLMQPYVDSSCVISAGHSRYGKTALCCAVMDERFTICAAAGSGCGGMASNRYSGNRLGDGLGFVETNGWLMREDGIAYWFVDDFGKYGNKETACAHWEENRLDFDAHFIGAVIAPRPLIVLEGLDDQWSNPFGTQISWYAVAEVYRFLGAEENCAMHFREGGHMFCSEDWRVLRDFVGNRVENKEKETIYKTAALGYDVSYGFGWRCPGRQDHPTLEDFFHGSVSGKQGRIWSFQ